MMEFIGQLRFAEILSIVTLLTGLIWLIDSLLFRPNRMLLVLSKEQESPEREPIMVEYARSFFPVLLIVLLVRSFVIEPFKIPSSSMEPTLLVGDLILANKFQYGLRFPINNIKMLALNSPKRGDVVIFRHQSNRDYIKRVVGLPGDLIEYQNKILFINGQEIKQVDNTELTLDPKLPIEIKNAHMLDKVHAIQLYKNIASNQAESNYRFNSYRVPPKSYYVLGDNRDASEDSRFWGCVAEKDLIGRAFGIWMSWDTKSWYNWSIRWHRIGKAII